MASSVFTPEIASKYGALDDTAIADGGPASAHAVRTLAMSTNRLLSMGEPMLSMMFDASEDNGGSGGRTARGYLNGFAWPNQWRRLFPAPLVVPKKQTHRRGEMRASAQIETGRQVMIQVVTDGCRYNNDAVSTSPNVLTMTGTGSFHTYSIESNTDHPELILGSYAAESIELYVKAGSLSNDLIDTATYGSPNTGTAQTFLGGGQITAWPSGSGFYDSTAAWNLTGNRLDDGSVIVNFRNALSSDELLAAPRAVKQLVIFSALDLVAKGLIFDPPVSPSENRIIDGSTYTLNKLPGYRIAAITINTADINT